MKTRLGQTPSERRQAEAFYLDLMGRAPRGGGQAAEEEEAEAFYLDLMGGAPRGVQGESAALVEDVTEDEVRLHLRNEVIEKARTKKTFLSAATVRAAVDGRASDAELSRLFDTGVAAAVPPRRRVGARGADFSAQLLQYWGLVSAYAQKIVELLERSAVRDWSKAMPMATASKPGQRLEGVMSAQGPLTDFKIDTSTDAKGIPTFSYRADVGTFTETADSNFPDAKKAAAQVQRGRERVQKTMMRTFVRINQATNAGRMAGFERSTRVLADAAVQARASQAEKDADRTYAAWLKITKISGDLAAFSSFEGDPASMQGSDKANLTWGPGIAASGGGFQHLMKDVIDKSPEARQAFLDIGIGMVAKTESGRWDFQLTVVDTEKKWILVSTDAELFIRARPELLAMFVNVAQGYTDDLVKPVDGLREIFLKAISARIPGSGKAWKSQVAKVMALRGVHSGSFGWGDFNENMTPDQVRAVLLTKMAPKLVDQIQASAGGGKPKAREDIASEGTATFPTLLEAWNADKRRIVFFFKPITTTFTDAAGGVFSARFWVTSDAVKWKIPASERDLLADWNRFKEGDPVDQEGDMLCRLPCTARQNQAFANALKLHPDASKPGAEDGLINRVAPIRSDMAPEPCLLLTPYLYARRYQQVSCKIDPVGRDTGKPIVAEAAKHNQYLNQKTTAFMRARNDSYRVPSIGDPGKIWAITNQMYVSRADNGQPSAINYGWHGPTGTSRSAVPGVTCIQSVGTRHDDRHVDYSQVCVLVAGWCEVTEPGQSAPTWVKTESVYTSARLCKLVTEDGTPLRRVRYDT